MYPFLNSGKQVNVEIVNEAIGSLSSLFFTLTRKPAGKETNLILYDILIFLGDLHRYLGRQEDAKAQYYKAIKQFPSNGKAYNQIATVLARDDLTLGLFYFVLSLIVPSPYSGARSNLNKSLSMIVAAKNSYPSFLKLVALVLQEKLTGKKVHYSRELGEVHKKMPAGFCPEEVHLLWMILVLEPGFMDTQSMSVPVEMTIFILEHGLKNYETSPWLFPFIQALSSTVSGFWSKTKRFDRFSQVVRFLVAFCNDHVLDESDGTLVTFEADAPFLGLSGFTESRPFSPLHDEEQHVKSTRIIRFAKAVSDSGLLTYDRYSGVWYTAADWESHRKKQKMGSILAQQRLKEEINKLEQNVAPTLQGAPWLIPDFAYLMDNWVRVIEPAITSHTSRFIITFPVLAELDYAKNGPSGILARPIIAKLADLTHRHDPSVRLQMDKEYVSLPGGRPSSPQEAHKYKFLEAVTYFQSHEKCDVQILSADPEVNTHKRLP